MKDEELAIDEIDENAQDEAEVVDGIELTDTTEEPVETTKEVAPTKKYDDNEMDKIIAKKLARQEAKLTRSFEEKLSKYTSTEAILNAGLGTKDISEAGEKLAEFYKEQGITMPEKVAAGYSDRDIEILAKADAEEIIADGIDEMTKEANRLADKGYKNLNKKEQVIFNTLATVLTAENQKAELQKIGVKPEILEDKEFKAFAKKFLPTTSVVEVYNYYTKGKTEVPKPIGSMASTAANKIKDFYTFEESQAFTKADFDRNPSLFKAVENSMPKW